MSYITIDSVVEAYSGCKGKTQNKFWGLLAILKAIDQQIIPGKSYTFQTSIVSSILDDLFCFSEGRTARRGSDFWSVLFSRTWLESIPEVMFDAKPNIYDVVVWFFRKKELAEDANPESLLSLFFDELHLVKDDIESLFDVSPKILTFSSTLYSEQDLLIRILGSESLPDMSKLSLSFEGTSYLKSDAGNLGQASFVQTLYSGQKPQKCLILTQFDFNKEYRMDNNHNSNKGNCTLQQIFYGAPGTGKSHEINRLTEGKNVVRTTFHPDTDYSTFVGCYKPHMEEVEMTAVIGETLKVVKDEKGNPRKEKRIVYKYSCQAFLQAYIDAWQLPEQEHYLVIEEINRGNCAQIFGDIFQLLDRNEEGFSSYPIKTDTDAENELRAVFLKEWTLADDKAQEIGNLYRKHYPNGITKDIKNGSLLLLPANLYIWATMNTSDQSLFPIDSAFKRRWDWKYIKISEGRDADTKELLNWVVKFNFTDDDKLFTFECSWWDFIRTINEKIASATSSDDKKLGYFFCKPKKKGDKEIDSETFVGKVVFYLWNDVFKDEDNLIFKVAEGKASPSFDAFYTENESGKTIVDTTALRTFMHNVFGEPSDLYTETEVIA